MRMRMMLLLVGMTSAGSAVASVPTPVSVLAHAEKRNIHQYEDAWVSVAVLNEDRIAHECAAPVLGPRGLDVIVTRGAESIVRLSDVSLNCAGGSVRAVSVAAGMALVTRIRLDGDWFSDIGEYVVDITYGGCDAGALPVQSAKVTILVEAETGDDAAARRRLGEWRDERQEDRKRARTLAEFVVELNREFPASVHAQQMIVQGALNEASGAVSLDARERSIAELQALLTASWLPKHRAGDVLTRLLELFRQSGAVTSALQHRFDVEHPVHVGELSVRTIPARTVVTEWSVPGE